MNCPKCGAFNADSATFCSLCHEAFKPVTKKSEEKKDTKKSKETEPASKKKYNAHNSPGFDIKVKKEPDVKLLEETKEKEETKKKSKLTIPTFTEWLFPAILATVISLAFFLVFPKEGELTAIAVSLPIARILIISAFLGVIVSTGGIVRANLRSFFTGWLLGLSSGFLSFNILFFGGFILQKINTKMFSLLMGSELVIISAVLGVAIALSSMIEKVSSKQVVIIGVSAFVVFVIIGAIISRWAFPVITFLAWPAGFYILQWQNNKAAAA